MQSIDWNSLILLIVNDNLFYLIIVPDIEEKNNGSEKYFAGIAFLAILLVISFVIIACLVYKNRCKSPSRKPKEETTNDGNNSQDINSDPGRDDGSIYEEVDNEESTYTPLKFRTGDEDHDAYRPYTHLNEVQKDYVNQDETAI